MSLCLAFEARKICQQDDVAGDQNNEVPSLSGAHNIFTHVHGVKVNHIAIDSFVEQTEWLALSISLELSK